MSTIEINLTELRIALARQGKTKLDLARALNHPPSTVASWLSGVAPMPPDLVARIEGVLGLTPGTLAPDSEGATEAEHAGDEK